MTFAFSFVFPFLLTMAICQRILILLGKPAAGWTRTVIIASLSALLVALPVSGLPMGRWLVSLYANPSIPMTALLFSWVLKNAFQFNLLDTKAARTCLYFSFAAGVVLYPMALGAGPFDPYGAGWHFSWLFVLLMAITFVLLFFKNQFSPVLLATILAYDFHLLESGNFWDYLVDPILVIVSMVGLTMHIVKRRGKAGYAIDLNRT